MMTQSHTSALIVTRPGPLRDGLQAIMTAIPQIEIVGETDSASLVLRLVIEHRPDLVLLDMDLPGNEAWTVLRQIKAEWPEARCIVLVKDVQQQQEAAALGADVVLLNGIPATKLIATVESLLLQRM